MAIAAKNLSYEYDPRTPYRTEALRGLSLTVEDGEAVAVMGRTGCGKSTLLQLLAGLLPPSAGTVEIDGEDINAVGYERSRLRRAVGLVFQYPETQLFETSVERDVAFGLRHLGLTRQEMRERCAWALSLCGFDLAQIGEQSPLGLSGGEKRRVAIAGVLAVRPRYLLLDEPFAGLDPLAREDFLALLRRLNREGVTVLVVSHNADCVAECARRLLVLDEGRLALDTATAAAFARPERLRALHLDASAAARIAAALRARGCRIPADVCTYGALRQAAASLCGVGETAQEAADISAQTAERRGGQSDGR